MDRLPRELWMQILRDVDWYGLRSFIIVSKEIVAYVDGGMLLDVIHGLEQFDKTKFVCDYVISIIVNDNNVDVENMAYKNYYPSKKLQHLLLKYILDYDVRKTILMLKLYGNRNLYFDNTSLEIFNKEYKKLEFCMDGKLWLLGKSYFTKNLHFAFLIFFTPLEIVKLVLPYMVYDNGKFCSFAYECISDFDLISANYIVCNYDDKKIDFHMRKKRNLILPLKHLYDGNLRIKYFDEALGNGHDNFYVDNRIKFDCEL